MALTVPLVGKKSRITVNDQILEARSVEATLEADQLEATHFASKGWREYVSGVRGGNWSFELDWNPTEAVLAAVPNFYRGVQYSGVFRFGPGGRNLTISGTLAFESWNPSAEVDGKVETTASGQFTGTITITET